MRYPLPIYALMLSGCVWMNETPKDFSHPAENFFSTTLPPEYQSQVDGQTTDGYQLPATAAVATFLGSHEFKMAFFNRQRATVKGALLIVEPAINSSSPANLFKYANPVLPKSFYEYGINEMPVPPSTCELSPDGGAVVYQMAPYSSGTMPSQWLQFLDESHMLTPLASSSNDSRGMLGTNAFWLQEGGKSYLLFSGLQWDLYGFVPVDSRMVEVYSGANMLNGISPITRAKVSGITVRLPLQGASRDGKWGLIMDESRSHGYSNLFSALDRTSDSLLLQDTLQDLHIGKLADINPFDPTKTSHTDYFVTTPYFILTHTKVDSTRTPRTVEDSIPQDTDGEIWICDSHRKIVWRYKLPVELQPAEWLSWSNHANFIVVGNDHLVSVIKVAASSQALLLNPETETLTANGILKVVSQVDGHFVIDAGSLWIRE